MFLKKKKMSIYPINYLLLDLCMWVLWNQCWLGGWSTLHLRNSSKDFFKFGLTLGHYKSLNLLLGILAENGKNRVFFGILYKMVLRILIIFWCYIGLIVSHNHTKLHVLENSNSQEDILKKALFIRGRHENTFCHVCLNMLKHIHKCP